MENFDLTLSGLQKVQSAFDAENFSGADTPEGKRRHVLLHLGKLLGKLSGFEEQVDHGHVDLTVVQREVIPDLLVFAAQLAEITNTQLATAYRDRLTDVAERNGTGDSSVARAFDTIAE